MDRRIKRKIYIWLKKTAFGLLIPLFLLAIAMLLSSCGELSPELNSTVKVVVDDSPLEDPNLNPSQSDPEWNKLVQISKSIAKIQLHNPGRWKCSGVYAGKDNNYTYIHTSRFCDHSLYFPYTSSGPGLTATITVGLQKITSGNPNGYINKFEHCRFYDYQLPKKRLNQFNVATLRCPKRGWENRFRFPRAIPMVYFDSPELDGRIGWDNMDCSKISHLEISNPLLAKLCMSFNAGGTIDSGIYNAKSQSVLMGINWELYSSKKPHIFISRKWPSINRREPAKSMFQGEECRTYWKQKYFISNNGLQYPPFDPNYPSSSAETFHGFQTFCSTPGKGASGGVALMKFNGQYRVFAFISGESLAVDQNTNGTTPYNNNILSAIPRWIKTY